MREYNKIFIDSLKFHRRDKSMFLFLHEAIHVLSAKSLVKTGNIVKVNADNFHDIAAVLEMIPDLIFEFCLRDLPGLTPEEHRILIESYSLDKQERIEYLRLYEKHSNLTFDLLSIYKEVFPLEKLIGLYGH
jgi:hypothetical protein